MSVIQCERNDFNDVIGIVLNNWTGLKMALQHGSGGPPLRTKQKLENLVLAARNLLETCADSYSVSDELEAILDEQFNTIIEDESSDEIAGELVNLYGLWMSGETDKINSKLYSFKNVESILEPFSRIGPKTCSNRVTDDFNSERMTDDVNRSNSDDPMDEDSEWTVVGKKKR